MIGLVGYMFCVCFILAATQILNAANHIMEKRISTRSINEELKEYAKVLEKQVLEVEEGGLTKEVGEIPRDYKYNALEVERLKKRMLKDLTPNQSEIINIERRTIGQYRNKEWLEKRKFRLTASTFGIVCMQSPGQDVIELIKYLLYNEMPANNAMSHGLAFESKAVDEFSKKTGIEVKPNGLFIDPEMPYLAASPDGLIGDDGLTEVKCPYVIRNMSPQNALKQNKIRYLIINQKTNASELYHFSTYYYQVQGQLHITRRKYCYFVVWTPNGMLYEKIYRDDDFWKKNMEKQLSSFYMNYMLPEIVNQLLKPKGMIFEKIYRDDNFWKEKMEKQLSTFYMDYMLPEIVKPQREP